MPTVRVLTSTSLADGQSYDPGEHQMPPERAQEAVAGGWGELVREQSPQTPEDAAMRRQPRPERRNR